MAEEVLVKLRQDDEVKISNILSKNERILIAFPYGGRLFDPGWKQQDEPTVFNHIVITNRQVFIIPKEWFFGKKEIVKFSYYDISVVELREQVMGTTLYIKVTKDTQSIEFNLDNCPKKEGEQALFFLQKMKGSVLCLFCFKQISFEFVYCPHCEGKLKRTCSKCEKILEEEWIICPYCGRKD